MEEQEKKEIGISEWDRQIIIHIAEIALKDRDIKKVISAENLETLSNEEFFSALESPEVVKVYVGDVPCLMFKFVGIEGPPTIVFFNPIEPIYVFLKSTRKFIKSSRRYSANHEEAEVHACLLADQMFLLLFDNFLSRGILGLESFVREVIAQFDRQTFYSLRKAFSERGAKVRNRKYPRLEEVIGDYNKEVIKLWDSVLISHINSEEEKLSIKLAREYDEKIKPHWNNLRILYRKGSNWRVYAKSKGFEDTPDDLLDKFENTDSRKLHEIAIEHAARRVGLIKVHTRDEVRQKRKAGLKVTDYEFQELGKYLKKGRELLANLNSTSEIESQQSTAHLEKQNPSEQNT